MSRYFVIFIDGKNIIEAWIRYGWHLVFMIGVLEVKRQGTIFKAGLLSEIKKTAPYFRSVLKYGCRGREDLIN